MALNIIAANFISISLFYSNANGTRTVAINKENTKLISYIQTIKR